jgi:DNA-binding phage protein
MSKVPLTRPVDEIFEDRVRREPAFATSLLEEAAQCLLNGEISVARGLVRDVIKGSIGYAELSRRTGTPEKSLTRMFGPNGNPTAENLCNVFVHLQRLGGVRLEVRSVPAPRKRPGRRTLSAPRHVARPRTQEKKTELSPGRS